MNPREALKKAVCDLIDHDDFASFVIIGKKGDKEILAYNGHHEEILNAALMFYRQMKDDEMRRYTKKVFRSILYVAVNAIAIVNNQRKKPVSSKEIKIELPDEV